MPLYEYACQKCDHDFETLVFGDEEIECPKCQARKVVRRLSVPARPPAEATSPCDSSQPPCGTACRRFTG
jgi:putative FmdB family regulatory protein